LSWCVTKLLRPRSVAELERPVWKSARAPKGGPLFSRNVPTSLVAAESHHGRQPAGICDGWLHCNIQVACHIESSKISHHFNVLGNGLETLKRVSLSYQSSMPKN